MPTTAPGRRSFAESGYDISDSESTELPFDESVIDFGGGNFAADMRVARRVGVDVLELFVDADDSRGFVQSVEERLPTLVFGVVVPGVEGKAQVFCEPQCLAPCETGDAG